MNNFLRYFRGALIGANITSGCECLSRHWPACACLYFAATILWIAYSAMRECEV